MPAPSKKQRVVRLDLEPPRECRDGFAKLSRTGLGDAEAYEAWQSSQDFDRAHSGGGDTLAPAAERSQNHLWSYEVVQSSGPHGEKS